MSVVLVYNDIEAYLEEIFTSEKIVCINSKNLLFRHPNNFIIMRARQIYEQEYTTSLADGLLSFEDMKKLISKRDIINQKERQKLIKLQSSLKAQKVLLSKISKVEANKDRVKNVITNIESQINEIEFKEQSKFIMTAEAKAEESKFLYLCWNSCYSLQNSSLFYWETYNDFLNELDLSFRQEVFFKFREFFQGISAENIRAIARSTVWRIRYITSLKTSESLFGVPTSKYTNNMLNLAYWSHYYQNIYDMMPEDQPSQDVIEDDIALDAYMDSYYKERNKEIVERKIKSNSGSKDFSAFNQEEVIVTMSNAFYEDIDYDKPREAQMSEDRNVVKKQRNRNSQNRVGSLPD